MSLPESVLQEIHRRVAGGFENQHSLFLRIFEQMADEMGLPDSVSCVEEMDATTSTLLRSAIASEFASKIDEMRFWPGTTNCDRLLGAFAELEKRGVVAFENCGFTQDDGLDHIGHVAAVREELGRGTEDGYCFFHDQDLMRAVDGEGLWLAFGTFKQDAPDHAREVGVRVVQACRQQGLEVHWNGSPETRIYLPRFQWRRRQAIVQESDVREFLESWQVEIRAGYTPMDEVLVCLLERANDWFAGLADFGPDLMQRLVSHTERFLEEERARELSWHNPTVNDRISAAFGELRTRHICAGECRGLTIQDGWACSGLEVSALDRGVVFFHHEDVIDCMDGMGLWLAVGAVGVEPLRDDDATHELAREVVSVLDAHGVPCSWEDSVRKRIHIAPFDWRRRRWTTPPPYETKREPTPRNFNAVPPCQASKCAQPEIAMSDKTSSCRQFASVVKAVRDERGFDLRRARQMRAAWKRAGFSGHAQVGHLGSPHTFVRTGEFTTMMPQPAEVNIREEKNEIFLRALRSREPEA